MKRNMELVRSILFALEETSPFETILNLEIIGYDIQEIAYHCEMMYDAGLIKEYIGSTCDGANGVVCFRVRDLTWEGHDFLDKIRSDTVWKKVKSTIKKKGLPMILDTIKTIATTIISSMTEGAIKGLKGDN